MLESSIRGKVSFILSCDFHVMQDKILHSFIVLYVIRVIHYDVPSRGAIHTCTYVVGCNSLCELCVPTFEGVINGMQFCNEISQKVCFFFLPGRKGLLYP